MHLKLIVIKESTLSKMEKYTAKKLALKRSMVHLLRLLRRDMQHFGIKVSIIEPGFFKTGVTRVDLINADLRRLWTRLSEDVKDSYGAAYFDKCK